MSEHHDHDHGHGHTHSHAEGENPYYLDQLCLVALSAAFGSICLAMYFWRTAMLQLMLGPQFHLYILISGVALVLIALIRGSVLWIQVGKGAEAGHAHHHHHDHDHGHEPGHEHHHHDHDHHHEGCGECHEHHHHEPGIHLHSHTHGDHDHGWAPWRYVVLLVPVILFLLGLPNKGPQVLAVEVAQNNEIEIPTFLAMGTDTLGQLTLAAAPYFRSSGKAEEVTFSFLEACGSNDALRDIWNNKSISVRGQFVPSKNDHAFSLGRFKINCCAADAVQLNVPIVCKESVGNIKPSDWVKVTGQINFFQDRTGAHRSMLRVFSRSDIAKTTPDPNPYLSN